MLSHEGLSHEALSHEGAQHDRAPTKWSWRDQLVPISMQRVVVAAPTSRFRRVLVEVADFGRFQPDASASGVDGPATTLMSRASNPASATPELSSTDTAPQDLNSLSPSQLAGEASLEQQINAAVTTSSCSVLPGWVASSEASELAARITPFGGAVGHLPRPRGVMPPTASSPSGLGRKLRPLIDTYATVPYRDIDPTIFAALTYVIMFGMMFGDVAHGAALVMIGVAAHFSSAARFAAAHRVALFLVGAGLAAIVFGFLYGEAFGPTGLVPTLWLRPLEEPETLLVTGLVVGSVLLAITFVIGSINRWRESGWGTALYDGAGVGGALLFSGTAAVIAEFVLDSLAWLRPFGAGVAALGAALVFIGLVANAGANAEGTLQAVIEMFDTLLRLGSNIVSFTRLAAFGLTHAVITEVVWDGTTALWSQSGIGPVLGAALLFTIGNIAAFALSGLVGAIQALRLEYYELFSRLFVTEGRPFQPWHVPTARNEAPPLDRSTQPLEIS